MDVIKTVKLTKYYGKSRGIIDLDLTVSQGEFFGFIGPNGAGKSTTIRTLLGLISPTFGSAEILGKDITKEKDKTAEFLLTHPVSRKKIITEKLIVVLIQITVMNIIIYALAVGSIAAIGEQIPLKEISLLHIAYYLLELELAGICFGISDFLRKGSVGIGLGIAVMMYFLNLVANIADVAEFLKYITPFGYCEGADIVSNGSLDIVLVAIGMVIGVIGIIVAFLKYTKKDIH